MDSFAEHKLHSLCIFSGILSIIRAVTFPWVSYNLTIHPYMSKEDALLLGVISARPTHSLHSKRLRAYGWQMLAEHCPASVFLISLLFIL